MGAERITGEFLKGHLPMLVLAIIEEQPRHGYDVAKTLTERSHGALALGQGTIYPPLYTLAASGLIASSTKTVNGRRRRIYRLTRAGRKSLTERKGQWQSFQQTVQAVLGVSRIGGEHHAIV